MVNEEGEEVTTGVSELLKPIESRFDADIGHNRMPINMRTLVVIPID